MALIFLDKDSVIEYIPESERGKDDPTIIKLKHVNYGKVKDYGQMIVNRTRGQRDEKHVMEISLDVQKKQFCEHVVGIENCFVEGRPITTAEELYEFADAKLITEIIQAMEDSAKLTEGQRKNS